jgi:hypothetical protein
VGDWGVFTGSDNVTIYGYTGSFIQTYAGENSIPFIAVDSLKGLQAIFKQANAILAENSDYRYSAVNYGLNLLNLDTAINTTYKDVLNTINIEEIDKAVAELSPILSEVLTAYQALITTKNAELQTALSAVQDTKYASVVTVEQSAQIATYSAYLAGGIFDVATLDSYISECGTLKTALDNQLLTVINAKKNTLADLVKTLKEERYQEFLSDIDKANIAIYSDACISSDGTVNSDGTINIVGSDGTINIIGSDGTIGTIGSDGTINSDGTLTILETYITSAGEIKVRVEQAYGDAVITEQGNIFTGIKSLEVYLGEDYTDFLTAKEIDVNGLITTFTAYTTATDLAELRTQVGLLNEKIEELKKAYDKYLKEIPPVLEVSSDGTVKKDVTNYRALEEIVLNFNSETLTTEQKEAADVRKDGQLDIWDTAFFKRALLNLLNN